MNVDRKAKDCIAEWNERGCNYSRTLSTFLVPAGYQAEQRFPGVCVCVVTTRFRRLACLEHVPAHCRCGEHNGEPSFLLLFLET